MELDLRLTTLERLDEALALPATAISIGNEGCPHKLPAPGALREAAARIRAEGRQVTFVAPIVYERFQATVLERIDALLADGPLTVVANDLGLLLLLVERGWQRDCTLAAGHGLSYSFEQQPWLELTLSQETPEVADLWRQRSLDDPHMLELLAEWGVRTIEVDNLPHARTSFPALQAAGFELNVLLDVVPVAYARSCHTARYYGVSAIDCTSTGLCDQPFELTTTHRWRLYHNQLEPMSKATRTLIPDLTVYGNVVYRSTADAPPPPLVERATLDLRYYTPESLRHRVDLIIGALSAS